MIEYARYVIWAFGIATFLALMVFNVDVVGPRGAQGAQAVASIAEAEWELCDENSVLCAVYKFPNGTIKKSYDETGVVITPEE